MRAKISVRNARSSGERGAASSTLARVDSISRSYWTPDGHAVTHAMQPKHASKCATTDASSGMTPSYTPFIRSMRPRGESISLPHDAYVGQAGKQNPQCTQSLIKSR